MTRSLQAIAVMALTSGLLAPVGAPLAAQGGVAVAGFETDGSVGLTRSDYDAMGRALTVLLSEELGRVSQVRVFDLQFQGTARMGRIDISRARAAATQAGAKYLIVGTMLDQYGDLRVEARLLDAATGDPVAVIRAAPAHGKREQLAESVDDLATGLGGRSELGGSKGAPALRAIPVDALVSFGQGLRFEEAGDRAKAVESYRAALKLAPGLTAVTTALRRAGG